MSEPRLRVFWKNPCVVNGVARVTHLHGAEAESIRFERLEPVGGQLEAHLEEEEEHAELGEVCQCCGVMEDPAHRVVLSSCVEAALWAPAPCGWWWLRCCRFAWDTAMAAGQDTWMSSRTMQSALVPLDMRSEASRGEKVPLAKANSQPFLVLSATFVATTAIEYIHYLKCITIREERL